MTAKYRDRRMQHTSSRSAASDHYERRTAGEAVNDSRVKGLRFKVDSFDFEFKV